MISSTAIGLRAIDTISLAFSLGDGGFTGRRQHAMSRDVEYSDFLIFVIRRGPTIRYSTSAE